MTSVHRIIDQELAQFGWVESVATNSISDFKSPKSTVLGKESNKKNYCLIDTFICHLIFYVIFCYSLFLYIVIDLGCGSFIKNKIIGLINAKRTQIPTFLQLIVKKENKLSNN